MAREFKGRPIKEETVSLGVGGQLSRDGDFPDIPPNARVSFQAEADYENVKYKFLDNGGVKETLILTINADTFAIVEVTEKPKEEELPLEPATNAE
jgi:hypothetical protein